MGAINGTDGRPVSRQLCGTTPPARSLAGSIALASRRLLVRGEGAQRLAGGSGRSAAGRRPRRRPDGRSLGFGLSRRHDLRPGRSADSPGRRGLGRPRSLPHHRRRVRRGGDELARRADQLLLGRPHGLRPQAEAGPLGAWRADHLIHGSRVRGRPVRDPRRDELLGAAHRRRGRAAAPAASAGRRNR